MPELRAYHNDPAIKERYLGRVLAHQKADQLVQGIYWDQGHGCAVGCTIHSSDHDAYERELGVPMLLARLEDVLFENMTKRGSRRWPERFLASIPVGADLSGVVPELLGWLFATDGFDLAQGAHDDVQQAIAQVRELYQGLLAGTPAAPEVWQAAEFGARDLMHIHGLTRQGCRVYSLWYATKAHLEPDSRAAVSAVAYAIDGVAAHTKAACCVGEKLLTLLEAAPVPAERKEEALAGIS